MRLHIFVAIFCCSWSVESFRIRARKAGDRPHDLAAFNIEATPARMSSGRPRLPSAMLTQGAVSREVEKLVELMQDFEEYSIKIMNKQGSVMASDIDSEAMALLNNAETVTSSVMHTFDPDESLFGWSQLPGSSWEPEPASSVWAPESEPPSPKALSPKARQAHALPRAGQQDSGYTPPRREVPRVLRCIPPKVYDTFNWIGKIRASQEELQRRGVELQALQHNDKRARELRDRKGKAFRMYQRIKDLRTLNSNQEAILLAAINSMGVIDCWLNRRPYFDSCTMAPEVIVDQDMRTKIGDTRSLLLRYDVPTTFDEGFVRRYSPPPISVYIHRNGRQEAEERTARGDPKDISPVFQKLMPQASSHVFYQDIAGNFVQVKNSGHELPDPVVGGLHIYDGYPKLCMLRGRKLPDGSIQFYALETDGLRSADLDPDSDGVIASINLPRPQFVSVGDLRTRLSQGASHLALPAVDGFGEGLLLTGVWEKRGVVEPKQDSLRLSQVLNWNFE